MLDRLALQKKLLMEHAEAVRLEEISRTKSDVISNVSHDLRSPLTSISLFAELLEKRLGRRDSKSADYLRVIRGESARLSRMITTILDTSRIEEGILEYRFEVIDFREVVDEVMEAMRYQLQEGGFTVHYRRPGKRLPVRGDRDALANVLVNLIGNSIKYSAEKKALEVALSADSRSVRCSVRDRGVGIPPGSLGLVFQRYYRDPDSRRSVKGMGLGLPLAKRIVDDHHGTIAIESTVGTGTAVELCFPIHARTSRHENHPDR
jgi:signal transduction histidine kinase